MAREKFDFEQDTRSNGKLSERPGTSLLTGLLACYYPQQEPNSVISFRAPAASARYDK